MLIVCINLEMVRCGGGLYENQGRCIITCGLGFGHMALIKNVLVISPCVHLQGLKTSFFQSYQESAKR